MSFFRTSLLAFFVFCLLPLGDALQSKRNFIPRQLILTGKYNKLEDYPLELRTNVYNNAFHPDDEQDIKVRYFSNRGCRAYIRAHYDKELLSFFDAATPGYYRGDICRAAILFREGGFYTDLDLQLTTPLLKLIDDSTTFMSVFSASGDVYNGLIAATPRNDILNTTLLEIRRWYRDETKHVNLMGTTTMYRALAHVVRTQCLDVNLLAMKSSQLQWRCGPHAFRMYKEGELLCFMTKGHPQPAECPIERKTASSNLMRYGFFVPGMPVNTKRMFIGWPRYISCKDAVNGCETGGHSSLLQKVTVIDSVGLMRHSSERT